MPLPILGAIKFLILGKYNWRALSLLSTNKLLLGAVYESLE